jgi:hypothetical protein
MEQDQKRRRLFKLASVFPPYFHFQKIRPLTKIPAHTSPSPQPTQYPELVEPLSPVSIYKLTIKTNISIPEK